MPQILDAVDAQVDPSGGTLEREHRPKRAGHAIYDECAEKVPQILDAVDARAGPSGPLLERDHRRARAGPIIYDKCTERCRR